MYKYFSFLLNKWAKLCIIYVHLMFYQFVSMESVFLYKYWHIFADVKVNIHVSDKDTKRSDKSGVHQVALYTALQICNQINEYISTKYWICMLLMLLQKLLNHFKTLMKCHFISWRAIFVDHPGFASSLECKFQLNSIFSLTFQIWHHCIYLLLQLCLSWCSCYPVRW